MTRLAALTAAVILWGGEPPPPPLDILAHLPLAHRAVVTAVNRHCGSCHHSRRSDNQAALAVFDLRDESWTDGLTEEQWDGFVERLDGKVTASTLRRVKRFASSHHRSP